MARPVLHIIGHAHLDPAWLWPWRDGCAEALTTMQSALDRMRETPGLCYTQSAAATYRWAREQDPRLFAEVKQRVEEGRWEVVNGWIVEPDCNIPSTESFVRHCLYGKRWFARYLGVDVNIGYNVDSFGHGAGLPQVLARAGYRYYVMMRPQAHEADLPMLFWWESDDGSRVLAWRVPTHYGQGPRTTADDLEAQLRDATSTCFPPGFEHGAFFLGVGNHGGGPTRAHLQRLADLQSDSSLPELRFSTVGAFLRAIERSPAFSEVPTVRGELQHHARGCYSAMGEIKALNRRAERSLARAETLSALVAGSASYPTESFREAWWNVLFNQFHDVLAGSSLRSCYVDARDSVGAACSVADAAAVRSLHRLARSVDTSVAPAGVLFVANTLPWSRPAIVQLDTFTSPNATRITQLRAADGRCEPVQWTAAEVNPNLRSWRRLTAVVELPACGYRAYHLGSGDIGVGAGLGPAVCDVRDDHFGIVSLPAEDTTELLAAPIGFIVIDDPSDTWAHGVDSFRDEAGRPTIEATQVIENGPVVRIVRQTARWQNSRIVLDLVTWKQIAAVELRLAVNWQERRQILKLEIPTKLANVRTFANVPAAVARRLPHGGEEPCQDWLALEGEIDGRTYSVGLVNDSTYAYDCRDGLLRLTCLRSAPFAEHEPFTLPLDDERPYLDQGWHERRFWIVCALGDYTSLTLHRRAEELQSTAEYVMDSAHPGTRSWEESLLSVGPENVALLAVKRAEDSDDIIVRVQEMQGRDTNVHIAMPVIGLDWSGPVGAGQMCTLAIAVESGRPVVRVIDLLERR